MPGGTTRNWESYGEKISGMTDYQKVILADPQTSGGLLISVDEGFESEFEANMADSGVRMKPFGTLTDKENYVVFVS